MIFRLLITWVLSARFPVETGDTPAYTIMLLAWSIMGLFRNFQRTWRESHLIGGWQSTSLSLYISFTALRLYTFAPEIDCRALLYYVLFPMSVVCECWIFLRIMMNVSILSRIAIMILLMIHTFGMSLLESRNIIFF